ncbi:SDR family oxidoreductase [Fodinibius sediminis]|uniref:NAD(P)-dependent dehydrogenase, short-chain alcohol dehydrogenase family n=1 Tax=Fodinibius sediminis TaxID=1214077 RepID=A0A521BEA9_9BACT|nr:SDR family oxidoreductase [Fodinibius sediminis]SMO45404.1 NAD(P)-dependent dehydrogenase, short-chain alcohol dehydrogenase family [Fodinibius sediminis]
MKGKVAVITGAASGIGRATAELFAVHGAVIVAADTDIDGANETLEQIKKLGEKGMALQVDISNEEQVRDMIEQTISRFGQLDFACNNAGIEGEQALTPDCSVENWNRVIDINLRGTWFCMKYEIPKMIQYGGAIVNISSIAGLIGFPGIPAYTSSKHGINGLTKTAALEYAGKGIRVNAICPGAIHTPMIDRFAGENTEDRQQLIAQHPMGRLGRAGEVAEAAVWLCSEKASFITGQTLAVDGGFTVR